jgi:hypothetical protein
MKIVDIIKEEVNNFLSNEGVADKYAERQFHIEDPNAEMDRIAMSGIKDTSMGELMGNFMVHGGVQINIYKNPKKLDNFDENVRAISSHKGNLYVAQNNGAYYHREIASILNDSNTAAGNYIGEAYEEKNNVTWHRIEDRDDFGYSISFRDFGKDIRNINVVKSHLDAVRRMNPTLHFIPMYWERLKGAEYNYDEILRDNPYGFGPEGDNLMQNIRNQIQSNERYQVLLPYINVMNTPDDLTRLRMEFKKAQLSVRNNNDFDFYDTAIDLINELLGSRR